MFAYAHILRCWFTHTTQEGIQEFGQKIEPIHVILVPNDHLYQARPELDIEPIHFNSSVNSLLNLLCTSNKNTKVYNKSFIRICRFDPNYSYPSRKIVPFNSTHFFWLIWLQSYFIYAKELPTLRALSQT